MKIEREKRAEYHIKRKLDADNKWLPKHNYVVIFILKMLETKILALKTTVFSESFIFYELY